MQHHRKYWGPDATALAGTTAIMLWEKQAKETWGYCHLFRVLSSRSGSVTQREAHPCLHLQHQNYGSEILPGGEVALKQEASNLFPKEIVLFETGYEEVQG